MLYVNDDAQPTTIIKNKFFKRQNFIVGLSVEVGVFPCFPHK